jgi:hypothetical protein
MPIEVLSVADYYANEAAQTMKILLAGAAGAGKTRLASTFPNPYYANMEGRLLSIRDRDARFSRILTVKALEDLRAALDQRPEVRAKFLGGPVDTIVLDTCDELARMIIKERLTAERKETMAISDWGYLADRLRDILRGFRNLDDLHVVLNVHVRDQRDEETGRIEYKPDIPGAVGNEISQYVDESFLLVRRSATDPLTGEPVPVRVLRTYADTQYPWLKDHSGVLPVEFPVDLNTDYERLAKAIFGTTTPRIASVVTAPPRVAEAVDYQPTAPSVGAGQAVSEDDAAGAGTATKSRPAKKAPARKKTAATEAPVEVPGEVGVDADVPPEPASDPAPEPTSESVPEPAGGSGSDAPGAVPENGTETVEAPTGAETNEAACAVCGTTDINENYLELSEARWGVYLCRTHFLERNKQK